MLFTVQSLQKRSGWGFPFDRDTPLPVRYSLFMHEPEALTQTCQISSANLFDDDSRTNLADLHKECNEFPVCLKTRVFERT